MNALKNLRYSARSLSRTPGLTLALLLSIALGIGSNASVQGFVHGLITRNLPLPGMNRIVSLFAQDAVAVGPVSYDDYVSLRNHLDAFELLGAARESQCGIVLDGHSSIMLVAAVTPDLADLLDLSLEKGVVISYRVWQTEFGATADVRGKPIRIDGLETRVAGIAPQWLEGLYFGRAADVWTPLREGSLHGSDRGSRSFWVLGRLRPGVSIDQAQAALRATRSTGGAIVVLPYTGMTPQVAAGLARIARLMRVSAGSVFFIACANVAAFLLGRASDRSRETAVRVALGAGRCQLAGQLLSDSVLISVTGGAAGTLLALWTVRIIPAFFFEQDAGQLVFAPDFLGIVAASAGCVAITIACGLTPLLEMRHDDPAAVLQRENEGPSKAVRHLHSGLVAAQMTGCCLLIISTGILLKGFHTALQTSAGERLGQPILAMLQAPLGFYRPDLGLRYFQDAERALRSLPGISAAAWAATLPGSLPAWQSMRIEPPRLPLRDVVMDVAAFTSDSLGLVKLPPVAGRMFGGGDTPETCRVVIINEAAAKELFDGDAVGRFVQDTAGHRDEIIGVVAERKVWRAQARKHLTMYYYVGQTGTPLGQVGPVHFLVPVQSKPARALFGTNIVSVGYFDALGLSPIAGRVFPEVPPLRGCRIGIINQEAAELYFGGNAVGGAVIDPEGRRTEIIGVVHQALLRTAQRSPEPMIYFPMAQDFLPRMTLILGARDASGALLSLMRRRLDLVPGRIPGRSVVTTLDAYLSRTAMAPERIATVLVGASGSMALALGILGLYGAMADAARQRRREIAVRIALGAPGWRVVHQVFKEGVRLAGAGLIAGTLGSLLVVRWLELIVPSAGSLTTWVWLPAPIALLGAVVIASVLPICRALTVNSVTIMHDG